MCQSLQRYLRANESLHLSGGDDGTHSQLHVSLTETMVFLPMEQKSPDATRVPPANPKPLFTVHSSAVY